jgi:hypothetical protein
MRTIDADKLVDMLYDNEFAVLCPLDEVSGVVDACPTVDAVPVVRCKDCVYWDDDPDTYGADDGPKGKCMKSFETMYADDFCSYGERKDGGDG